MQRMANSLSLGWCWLIHDDSNQTIQQRDYGQASRDSPVLRQPSKTSRHNQPKKELMGKVLEDTSPFHQYLQVRPQTPHKNRIDSNHDKRLTKRCLWRPPEFQMESLGTVDDDTNGVGICRMQRSIPAETNAFLAKEWETTESNSLFLP